MTEFLNTVKGLFEGNMAVGFIVLLVGAVAYLYVSKEKQVKEHLEVYKLILPLAQKMTESGEKADAGIRSLNERVRDLERIAGDLEDMVRGPVRRPRARRPDSGGNNGET